MSAALLLAASVASACGGQPAELLQRDGFDQPGAPQQWALEIEPKPGSAIRVERGRMLMDVAGGATAWLRQPLSGNYVVSFRRKVVMAGGANDRVSDLNVFWAARDPASAELFTRSGKFEDYDGLRMYYVGIGGNTNTTTRLRRYEGGEGGARVLLGERLGPAYLLVPNHDYRIAIAVFKGCTSVSVDGKLLFVHRDPRSLADGYVGLRTTWSRQEIDEFEVRRLR